MRLTETLLIPVHVYVSIDNDNDILNDIEVQFYVVFGGSFPEHASLVMDR